MTTKTMYRGHDNALYPQPDPRVGATEPILVDHNNQPVEFASFFWDDLAEGTVGRDPRIINAYEKYRSKLPQDEPLLYPLSARELVESAPTPTWLVDGILPGQGLTLFHSRPKLGKSTMTLTWLRAMEDGSDWAGKAVKPTAALLLTEENGSSLAEAFEEVGLDLDGPHGFLPVENASTEWSWGDILNQSQGEMRRWWRCSGGAGSLFKCGWDGFTDATKPIFIAPRMHSPLWL